MKLLKRLEFSFAVFLTGSAVLILEILATRLLSPYFGNTIYSLSSILSVVLLALAIAYFLGGWLSDRYPKKILFCILILISSCFSYGIYFFDLLLLPKLSDLLSITTGPLVASLLVLFIPCFLMGLLCPYAIKLNSLNFPKVGIG